MTTDTILTVLLAAAITAPLIALMERSHRRARDTVDAFGPGGRRGTAADRRRILDDLRVLAGSDPAGPLQGSEPAPRPGTRPAGVTSLSRVRPQPCAGGGSPKAC